MIPARIGIIYPNLWMVIGYAMRCFLLFVFAVHQLLIKQLIFGPCPLEERKPLPTLQNKLNIHQPGTRTPSYAYLCILVLHCVALCYHLLPQTWRDSLEFRPCQWILQMCFGSCSTWKWPNRSRLCPLGAQPRAPRWERRRNQWMPRTKMKTISGHAKVVAKPTRPPKQLMAKSMLLRHLGLIFTSGRPRSHSFLWRQGYFEKKKVPEYHEEKPFSDHFETHLLLWPEHETQFMPC